MEFKNFCKMAVLFIVIMMTSLFTSCTENDEPTLSPTISYASVKFTFDFSENFYEFYEVSAVYNNAQGTDIETKEILDPHFELVYEFNKFPATAPVQFNYRRTNRPTRSLPEDITFSMKEEITMIVNGETVVVENTIPIYDVVNTENGNFEGDIYEITRKYHNFGLIIQRDANIKWHNCVITN